MYLPPFNDKIAHHELQLNDSNYVKSNEIPIFRKEK